MNQMKRVVLFVSVVFLLNACSKDDNNERIFTFENVNAGYLAGPTAYGENLYDGATGQYTTYTDPETGLTMGINEGDDYAGGLAYNFWNGGIVISQWTDMTIGAFDNQCSVFYKDAATGFGGFGGSKTFAVVHCGGPAEIAFNTAVDREFSYIWVTNSTYAALSMLNGNDYAKKFATGDWFKLTVTGYKANGSKSGEVEFYLADFRTANAGGIVREWKKIDLAALGKINKLSFALDSSDSGEWGMNTPAYFCFDNPAFFE
jgi:hypothetical protein